MRKRQKGLGEDGMMIMAVALIFNFMFVVALMMPRPTGGLDQSMKRTIHYATIHSIRNNLKSMVTDSNSWSNTIADAANVKLKECLSPPYPDCTGFLGPIRLRNSANQIFYDSVTSNMAGFNLGGVNCEISDSDRECIFKVSVIWTAKCPVGGPCFQPPSEVAVKITMKDDSTFEGVALDTKPWDIVWNVQ